MTTALDRGPRASVPERSTAGPLGWPLLISGLDLSGPGAGFFWGRRLGGWGGKGGGALLGGSPGWAGLLCWLKASITLGVLATGGGGVGARGLVDVTRRGGSGGWTAGGSDEDRCRLILSTLTEFVFHGALAEEAG